MPLLLGCAIILTMNDKPGKNLWKLLGRSRTAGKVAEELGGDKAQNDLLAQCGYAGQPAGLAARLSVELGRALPLCLDPATVRSFGSHFQGKKVMARARQEAEDMLADQAPEGALPASQWRLSPEQMQALWPYISGHLMTRLARAYLISQDPGLARSAAQAFQRFMLQNQPLMGFGWAEDEWLAVRALNWVFALAFLKDISAWSPKLITQLMLQFRVMGLVMAQGVTDPSQSDRRRTIGHAGALLFLGSALPFMPEASKWLELGQTHLGSGLAALCEPGPPLATGRLAAAVQWGGLGLWLGCKSNLELPGVVAGLRKLIPICRALAPPWGSRPEWGWTPLTKVLDLGLEEDPYTTGANLAALICKDPDLRAGRVLSEPLYWIFGPGAGEGLRQLAGGSPPPSHDHSGAGLSILCEKAGGQRTTIFLRTSPLISTPGPLWEAQSLDLIISLNAKPLLVTPGPPGSGPMAPHLTSRAAHNVMQVDGREPQGGRVEVESLESYAQHAFVAASYDGYSFLSDPVQIRRRVFWDREACLLNIVDQVQSQGEHFCEIFFHLPPDSQVKSVAGGVLAVEGPFGRAWLRPETKAQAEVVSGRSKPPLGWLADGRGKILAAPVVVVRAKIRGSTRLTNVILLRQP